MDTKLLIIIGVVIFILWMYQRGKTLRKLGITVSGGRARCYVCNERIDGRIYNIGDNRYFCRKHAIKACKDVKNIIEVKRKDERHTLNYKTTTYEAPEINKRKSFKGRCEYCKKKIEYKFDRFYCSYCQKWHCPEHRIPENHECKGNPPSMPKPLREIWSKGKVIVTGR